MEKITGLAGAIAIALAIIVGIVAMPDLNSALIILILGIIAGITAPQDSAIRVFLAVLVLPIIGSALSIIPAVGEPLGAISNNLAVAAAGLAASLVARRLYELVMGSIRGLNAK